MQLGKLEKFAILKVSKNSNEGNYKNFQFEKFQKFAILRMLKIYDCGNPNNFQCGKFHQFTKLSNFENRQFSEIV